MSLSKFKPVLPTEMDEALEELYAEFDRTFGIPSSANPISSTSVNNKRSSDLFGKCSIVVKICIAMSWMMMMIYVLTPISVCTP